MKLVLRKYIRQLAVLLVIFMLAFGFYYSRPQKMGSNLTTSINGREIEPYLTKGFSTAKDDWIGLGYTSALISEYLKIAYDGGKISADDLEALDFQNGNPLIGWKRINQNTPGDERTEYIFPKGSFEAVKIKSQVTAFSENGDGEVKINLRHVAPNEDVLYLILTNVSESHCRPRISGETEKKFTIAADNHQVIDEPGYMYGCGKTFDNHNYIFLPIISRIYNNDSKSLAFKKEGYAFAMNCALGVREPPVNFVNNVDKFLIDILVKILNF